MSRYAKSLVALLGAVAQAVNVAALPDGAKPWFALAAAFLTVAGVYKVPNAHDDAPAQPALPVVPPPPIVPPAS